MVTPPSEPDTKKVEVKYIPEGATDPITVVAKKGNDGKWKLPQGTDLTINEDTGVITIPADKVKDGSTVSAKATDESGNVSKEGSAKAKGKVLAAPNKPNKTEVGNPNKLTDDEKEKVRQAIEDANDFEQGTQIDIADNGTATITYPDGTVYTIDGKDLVKGKDKTGAGSGDKSKSKTGNKGGNINVKTSDENYIEFLSIMLLISFGLFIGVNKIKRRA